MSGRSSFTSPFEVMALKLSPKPKAKPFKVNRVKSQDFARNRFARKLKKITEDEAALRAFMRSNPPQRNGGLAQ